MLKYTNQMSTACFHTETKRSYTKKHGDVKHIYCNDILTFDIEVTSAWIDENGKIIGYRKGESADYWNNLQHLSLCYIWQFSFNDTVYYGRELRDFEQVLKDLPKDMEIVIWVHNLSYEFHFLNNFLKWKSVFARTPHKPMKCVPEEYPNIEFRCSYMLTRLSLDSWGKQIGFHKDVGFLDYETIRTPYTELTDKEMQYCEDDCLVVFHGIEIYRKRYGNIRDIPLTQTGTVRKVVKEKLMGNKDYVRQIKKLVPKTPKEYKLLMNLFAGGYTHANKTYSGKTIHGYIEHYDFASSYPSVMVCEKYPMTPWIYLTDKKLPTDEEIEENAYILILQFTGLESVTLNTYIQSSKCTGYGMRYDNGRVLRAEELTITCTEQDWLTIKETYVWKTVKVLRKYESVKDYLPKTFIDYILELYSNKTTLKDVQGMEDLYMQSKQYINSMFGMCVTGIVQPDVKFDGSEWSILPLTEVSVRKRLDKLKDWHDREKRYFLSYSWGCWITAYARRNLWKCIISCDFNCLYCDTDSIFVLGRQDFTWYNNEINEKMKKACDYLSIDYSRTRPKTPKGKEKPLGIFAAEDPCSEFRTLGAKRYCERRISDNKLHLTVSGINKEAVELLNNNIDNFDDGFDFNMDADCVSKRLVSYVTDMPEVMYPDGYYSTYKEGINMRRTGYLLTMTDEYKKLIQLLEMPVDNLSDHSIIRLKSSFRTETTEEV